MSQQVQTTPTTHDPLSQQSSPSSVRSQPDQTAFSETNSTDSRDSKSRPLKVGESHLDSNWNPIDPTKEEIEQEDLEHDISSAGHSAEYPAGIRKSDSLDSARAACCTRLASSLYHKALESAKKALPKHKHHKDRRHQFPRSFGEDFGSIGPNAFNYLDDSQTECSGSYQDIDFNRDSYYLGNGFQVIPELPESEALTNKKGAQFKMEDETKPVITVVEDDAKQEQVQPEPYKYDLSLDPSYYYNDQMVSPNEDERDYMKNSGSLEEDLNNAVSEEVSDKTDKAKVTKKPSFIGRIFRKRDRSADKENKKSKDKSKKASSASRECSMEKSSLASRGQSLPPSNISETERSLVASLEESNAKRSPSPSGSGKHNPDDVIFSNISRQSPANLVYTRPPDIYVEECRTLPRNRDELAAQTSEMILADVLNQMYPTDPNGVAYANLDFTPLEPPAKKESKRKTPKKFFKKFGKSKTTTEPPELSNEAAPPDSAIVIEVTDTEHYQTEEELQEKPLPEIPIDKKTSIKVPGKQKKLFLKKDNFKLKDKFKNKKKQKDTMEAYAKRQLPTLPESRHSTLNSAHVYDRIMHEEPEKLKTDEFGNVIIDIGQPLEPGVDYMAMPQPEELESEFEVKLEQPKVELRQSCESLEVPVEKPVSPPPKIVDVVPAEPRPEISMLDLEKMAFESPHPVIIGQIAIFEKIEEKEIGLIYDPSVAHSMEYEETQPEEVDTAEQKKSKMGKLKNMMGSLGQSVRAKVKDIKEKVKKHDENEASRTPKESMEREVVLAEVSGQIVTLKETNLDDDTHVPMEVQQQFSAFSYRNFEPSDPVTPEIQITVEEVPPTEVTYEVDADLDEAVPVESEKKKKVKRKFKLTRGKKNKEKEKEKVVVVDVEMDREEPTDSQPSEITADPSIALPVEEVIIEPKQSWSSRNRQRLERLRSRAAESFKEVKEKIAAKTKRKKSDTRHDPDMYEYEFKFASDSELSPGSGVDSLRRSKVYQEMAEAQERLELYMSPVGMAGPLRPPRAKPPIANESMQSHRSMPSLAMAGRRLPPPPRPPPPKLHSYHSVPAIETVGDEISLSTSMDSSLWPRTGSRRNRRATSFRQRVPADIFYRNVRLGYRPKKSYMELLEKSQDFYSMANLHRAQSMSQLPVAPSRKSKTLFAKRVVRRETTSPPPPNSRASMVSNYGEVPSRGASVQPFYDDNEIIEFELDPELVREKELYEKYDKPRTPAPNDPLAWQPFSWKVKRCRSLTEIDVRGENKAKQARCSVERSERPDQYRSQTPSEYGATSSVSQCQQKESQDSYSNKIISWLASTTSLDAWRRNKRDRSVPSKPPRPPPPLPPARSKSSRPCSPTSTSASFFPSSNTLCSASVATLTQNPNAQCSNFAGRPLPPPPVPPRPKLIPAHYATSRKVEKRDACVDTSENGFLAYHCSEKETQVKLPSNTHSGSLPQEDFKQRLLEETNLDDEEELTIVEEVRKESNGRQYSRESPDFEIHEQRDPETVTSASVYEDARSRLTDQVTPVNNSPARNEWSDDDDTINDDISSLSSNYQSLCSSIQSAPPTTQANSWLHRQQPQQQQQVTQSASAGEVNNYDVPSTVRQSAAAKASSVTTTNTSTTTDEYLTAMEGGSESNATLSNRSSLLSDDPMLEDEDEFMSYERFQQQFANMVTSPGRAEDESGSASQRQSSLEQEETNPSGATSATDPKRLNRQSVISTISSTSSDTSSSLFHTHSSSPTSTYSFDSSVSIVSIPQAAVTGSATSTPSQPSSTFYVGNGTGEGNENSTLEAASTSAEASDTVNEPLSDANILQSDGCTVSKASLLSISQIVVNHDPNSLGDNLKSLPITTPKGHEPDKAYFAAHELVITELAYVDVLKMLTEEFREAIHDAVPDYFLQKFFRPLDLVLPINVQLLEDLQKRVMTEWDDNPRISDIMIKICPYFKEYSIFVREFDQLKYMLEEAQEMFPMFQEALVKFQSLERCKKLSIQAYLLKPIQRLPQYPMLLKEYLKRVKPDSPEYEETKHAIKVVTEVVEHVNRESLMAERAIEMNELKNRIISKSPDAIVKPGRELIKQGTLHKVSRKEVHERYFILFNDALLYLVPVMNDMLKLNEEFPLEGMEVEISNQADNEFVIRSFRRSFALMTRDSKERSEWVEVLEKTISEYEVKRSSFEAARLQSSSSIQGNASSATVSRSSSSPSRSESINQGETPSETASSVPKEQNKELVHQSSTQSNFSNGPERRTSHSVALGERAPVWVHDHRVTMCQRCMRQFTVFYRRHHCRACGFVVCTDCSSHHYPLKYRKNEPQRVCDVCYDELVRIHPEGQKPEEKNNSGSNGSGSTRVSPNHSLSSADLVAIKHKSRSNSCTDLGSSVSWSDLHNQSLPASMHADQNHNPTGIFSSINLALNRNQNYRLSSRARKNIPAVLVEVQANDSNNTMSGYMSRLSAKKVWKRYWFLIKDMVLYTYKASEDVAALESLPLPGYKVSTSKDSIKGYPAKFIIELSHPGRSSIFFFTENSDAQTRWLKAFRDCAELH